MTPEYPYTVTLPVRTSSVKYEFSSEAPGKSPSAPDTTSERLESGQSDLLITGYTRPIARHVP